LIIDHGNDIKTLYGHLTRVDVAAEQKVERGQVVAHTGNTGRSSGPHLHYEIQGKGQPVNPRSYLWDGAPAPIGARLAPVLREERQHGVVEGLRLLEKVDVTGIGDEREGRAGDARLDLLRECRGHQDVLGPHRDQR